MESEKSRITILGVGNILYSDEGFGVRVVEELGRRYEFPENVDLYDGGVLGMNLLSVIVEADILIVVDAVRNRMAPGTLIRLEGEEIPQRVLAKNSLHQVDLLEALTLAPAAGGKTPETIILGVEPADIDTLAVELTPVTQAQIDPMIELVLKELDRLGVAYTMKEN